MAGTGTVQVQVQTRGAVPEGAASFAVHRVSSLLRMAPEPVLSARVKLTMAAGPAAGRPAIAQVNIDLNGRPIRAQAAGQTMREATGHACDRLRIRMRRAARNRAAIRGRPAGGRAWRMAAPEPAGAAAALLPPAARRAHDRAAQVLRAGSPEPR